MKKIIAAVVLIGIAAYFWVQPSAEPPPQPRERHRPAAATAAAPANNPTRSASSIGTAPNTDGSLASRWGKGSNAPTNLTATVPDRWKTGANAQTDLTASVPDRWKTGPKYTSHRKTVTRKCRNANG